MRTLLTVDPGLRGCGVAYFVGPELKWAGYPENPEKKKRGPEAWFAIAEAIYFKFKDLEYRVDEYVCEIPQVYRQSKGDPNDLIEISGVAAAVGALFPCDTVSGYKPREWKGQIKKELHHPRIIAQLSPEEMTRIAEPRKTLLHNVYDAIGIGLYHLDRKGVRAWNMTKGL